MLQTRAELYGESIFTSFRSVNGAVPLFDNHLLRVYSGVNDYYLAGRLSFDEFVNYFIKPLDLVEKFKQFPNDYFRLTFYADNQNELVPINFSQSDLKVELITKKLSVPSKALKLKTTASPYSEDYIPFKAGSYFPHFYLKQKAMRCGFDDVLFLRGKRILEASTSNIVFIHGDTFYSPTEDGIFPGIGIELLKIFCKKNNLKFRPKTILKNDLKNFEAAFLINSVKFLTPIKAIEEVNYSQITSAKYTQQFEKFMYNGI